MMTKSYLNLSRIKNISTIESDIYLKNEMNSYKSEKNVLAHRG